MHLQNRGVQAGFTLLELLVVIAIIGILATVLLPALAKAKKQGRKINEISAGRQLMLAYSMYADDHQGRVLPGYRYGFEAFDQHGTLLKHPINARYPWRLGPYLDKNFRIMYVNENLRLLEEFEHRGQEQYVYAASVFPSFGINSTFVGGDDLELPPGPASEMKFGKFWVEKQGEARRPDLLIVFGSARAGHDEKVVSGYYLIRSPALKARRWPESYDDRTRPELFGYVHPRYNGAAVTAMLDGHVEVQPYKRLLDMRLWSNQAAAEGRSDWVLK